MERRSDLELCDRCIDGVLSSRRDHRELHTAGGIKRRRMTGWGIALQLSRCGFPMMRNVEAVAHDVFAAGEGEGDIRPGT